MILAETQFAVMASANLLKKLKIPVVKTARKGDVEAIKVLLDKGANLEAVNENGQTPLHCAAREGHKKAIKVLLDKGANLEAVNEYGQTPLHRAARCGSFAAAAPRRLGSEIFRWCSSANQQTR